ncbi:MAG: HAD-IIIA family hydrolase [Bacteroidetes bacterium]|nr:MAG: HAD-IIIA family hydrolase [Bacteroidota bacterium]
MDWPSQTREWCLFLDRDGVINERIFGAYVRSVDEFKFLPGSLDAIAHFHQIFQRIFVVTNQQGIGKGLMTERNLHEIHRYMCEEIERQGGRIDQCYFAPELKSDPNNSRKPGPFMALRAQSDFPEVNFEKSIMVGDTDSDILFGKKLGMKTVRIRTAEPISIEADLTVEHLNDLIDLW